MAKAAVCEDLMPHVKNALAMCACQAALPALNSPHTCQGTAEKTFKVKRKAVNKWRTLLI